MPGDNIPSMFTNARGVNINGGQFNNVGRDQINSTNYYSTEPLERLWQLIHDVGAGYNSETRYPPPQCHPETRRDVLKLLLDWIHSDSPHSIMWLYGPAGAGKSAIAQTIAETAHDQNMLAASFFFWRGDPKRNNPRYTFLSLAHDLALSIPELREYIEQAIRANPRILQASLEDQFEKLILEPCRSLSRERRYRGVLVIDGLDECDKGQTQQRVLYIFAKALLEVIPFRILICSRPEPAIRDAFNTDRFRAYLCRVALDATFRPTRDIEIFLSSEFERIRTSPNYLHIPFPFPWPAPGVIYELTDKASGQFIYAKTVVKFVDDEYFNPCEQLEHILHPEIDLDPESNSPFHDLDMLYHQILSSNPRRSKARDVMRALLSGALPNSNMSTSFERTPRTIECLLFLREGDVLSILCGMHSVLEIGSPNDEIHILHASFSDFLRNSSRSGYFFVGDDEDLHGFLAYRCLRVIDHESQVSGGNREVFTWGQFDMFDHAWMNWGYYCSRSNLNDDVLDALRAVIRQNSNFMKLLGSYLTEFFCDEDPYRMVDMTEIFLRQAGVTLQRLRVNPSNQYANITQRLLDCRKGFLFQADQPISESLNDRIDGLSHCLISGRMMSAFLSGKVVSIGNDCSCTRAEEATSLLFLPCSESTFRNVYHIQFSVAIVKQVGVEVRKAKRRLSNLYRVLALCDPCPELLNLLPVVIAETKSRSHRDEVLKWLESSPPEYKSQTLPLIEQLHQLPKMF
ncbi:nwd2 [Moniliophthora roreri MCA 2997]|uniref:Nwd2 n=2 Tax=Moniliophthora roreri TaxID=221103 RepID=V2XS47_MONRO|nr:nwd2 [Moniliophthora roreri MCA 2997]KAI3618797.1 nwd2 [Moniliophthora roreri]